MSKMHNNINHTPENTTELNTKKDDYIALYTILKKEFASILEDPLESRNKKELTKMIFESKSADS